MLLRNMDQGVQLCNASRPSSQNKLSNAALNPDIIDAFFCVDNCDSHYDDGCIRHAYDNFYDHNYHNHNLHPKHKWQ